jgi:ATP-dependent Clp protease protease subunit
MSTKLLMKKQSSGPSIDIDSLSGPQESLARKGIYYITGEIEDGSLLEIHQDILLKHLDPSWRDDIQLIVNSVGGSCAEGWALIDLLDWVRMDIKTVGLGQCCSLGAVLIAAGTIGKRSVTKNTTIMIHGAWSTGLSGNKQQLAAQMKDMELEHNKTIRFWMSHSKHKTQAAIEKSFLDGLDKYFTPPDALEHEIIDEIIGETKIESELSPRKNKR